MTDETEGYRRNRVAELNSATESNDKQAERKRLAESEYVVDGIVYDTNEMSECFDVLAFAAPLVVVRRRSDGITGTLEFQHMPRFYFNWQVD